MNMMAVTVGALFCHMCMGMHWLARCNYVHLVLDILDSILERVKEEDKQPESKDPNLMAIGLPGERLEDLVEEVTKTAMKAKARA